MITRRATLATRIAILSAAIAVGTAVIAGALAIGLIRTAGNSSSRHELRRLADAAQSKADHQPPSGRFAIAPVLHAVKIRYATVSRGGSTSGDPLARAAAGPGVVHRMLSGRSISLSRTVDDKAVFVEGRPTTTGGILLVQRRSDANALTDRAIRRTALALLIAAAVAAGLGLLVAWRMAIPLRRTAAAAHALAAGRRDVAVAARGPAEIAAVADAVNTLSGALGHSENRQRDFLMSVSHDLRTPLTALTGYAESLAHGVVPAEQTGQVGAVMLAEAGRLERLVADLLDLSRLDAQDLRLDVGPVDLAETVRSAAQVWSDRCCAEGIEFRLEVPAGELPVRTDAARVRQALDGLLENALRITPAGAPIVLAARPDAGRDGGPAVTVEVRDGGPGLTDDDIAVAFDRGELYRRYRGIRQVGTGLGLAIVHRLVVLLGGTIDAGRAVEGGARFTVRLPAGALPAPSSGLVTGAAQRPSAS